MPRAVNDGMAGDDLAVRGPCAVRPWARRLATATGVAVLLLTGCTSDEAPDAPGSPAPSPTPATAATPESQTPKPTEEVRFVYQPPDSPCAPVSALETLPLPGGDPYILADPFFSDEDRFGYLLEICTYELATLKSVEGRDKDRVLTDHVQIEAQFRLYRDHADSTFVELHLYPELPPEPGELDEWDEAFPTTGQQRAWWEECEPAPCAEGQDPSVRTYAFQRDFRGHVGNLEFDMTVAYIGETLPPGVEVTVVSVARDVVLAMVATKERVDSTAPASPAG